jgi:NADPH:quinone reductase-like Zn-dependent oxidoreductase
MRALVQDRYGSPDVLRIDDVPTPVPGDNEVLVRVKAASVNARDWHVMRGEPRIARLLDSATFGGTGPKVSIRGPTPAAGWRTAASPNTTKAE